MSKQEEFARGMAAVFALYGNLHDRELGFACEWADDVTYESDGAGGEVELDGASICFRKDAAKYWFLVGDGHWDADDPRSEMIEVLLEERAEDGEALTTAKTALDAAEVKLREVAAERDEARVGLNHFAKSRTEIAVRMAEQLVAVAKDRDAAIREADRLRHGAPIEGDFVCPDSLALTAMAVARDEACRILDDCIRELAAREKDPAMMDGHRALVAKLRAVGEE